MMVGKIRRTREKFDEIVIQLSLTEIGRAFREIEELKKDRPTRSDSETLDGIRREGGHEGGKV